MTKETKLALIIGFALILLVGILVGEHFSEANQANPADLTLQQSERRLPPLASPIRTDTRDYRDQRGSWDQISDVDDGWDGIYGTDEPVRRGSESVVPTGYPTRTHVVKPRESLRGLALRYLGAPERWREIHALNADVLPPGEADLREGMRLRVPLETTDPDPDLTGRNDRREEQRTTPSPRRELQQNADSEYYVVQENDNLWSIAEKQLGSGARWQEIVDANKDKLKNPDLLREGMKLRIPKR